MGAAQDQRVGLVFDDVLERMPQGGLGLGRLGLAPLDEVHQIGCGLGENTDGWIGLPDRMQVLAAVHGALGRDHPHPPVPGGFHGSLGARSDYADDRNIEHLARRVEGRRGGGVAGYHDQLHVQLLEEADDVERELPDLGLVSGPVGKVGQVGEVNGGFVWELPLQLSQNGEPSNAGIEDADRPRIAHPIFMLTTV